MADSAADEDQYPVQHVVLHGDRVAYRRAGSGPTLLLLHGIAGSSSTWLPAIRLLESRFTLIAPDFLGHGASDKPDGDYSLGNHASAMRDLLRLLGVDRVTVVGQSFGGGVALQFSYQYPELCERLVLVDAGGLGREVSWMLRLLAVPGVELCLPVVFPHIAADRGLGAAVRARPRRPQSPRRRDVAFLPLPDRPGVPPGLPPDDALGHRHRGTVGECHRPALPGGGTPDPGGVGCR